VLGLALLVGVGTVSPAGAAPTGPSTCEQVRVAEVSGLLDDVLVDFVQRTIEEADACGAVAVVLQVDSPGAVVDRSRVDELLALVAGADVPITVWVGPSGAEARHEAAELLEAADVAALADSTTFQRRGQPSRSAEQAFADGVTDIDPDEASTVGGFIVNLADEGIPVESVEATDANGRTGRTPVTPVRFSALPLVDQLAHTVGSPPVAYLLFVMGMALLLFELFTAGVGVAGVVGAGFLVLGAYGLAVLPTSPVAVGLLVLSMFGFAVDIQTGVPRVWTGVGTAAFVVGSLLIYRDDVELSWITLLIAVVGMVLAMLGGMPAMVRARFSTPTIGREWMIGEQGTARTAIDPDGTVVVRDAPWRARTNRATPIPAGAPVRVAAIDALVLEVEPLGGGARDYRDGREHRAS
jgi:membrane-bound serine protease (ClpP class)